MLTSTPPVIAILASGRGTNFEALVRAQRAGAFAGRIALLAGDHAGAPVFDRARALGVEAVALPAGRFRTRLEDERPWIEALRGRGVDLVLLAGFMRRLHAPMLEAFPERILNLHPSLLPAFPGLDAIRRAFEHGVGVTGCTVHVVSDEVDGGPIVAQEAVPVLPDDRLESLEERVHQAEHRLYPEAVRRFVTLPWTRVGRRLEFARGVGEGSLV